MPSILAPASQQSPELTHFIINTAALVSLSVAENCPLALYLTQHESLSPLCLIWADLTLLSYSCPLALPHAAPAMLILLLFVHTRYPQIESPAPVILFLKGSFPKGTWSPYLFFSFFAEMPPYPWCPPDTAFTAPLCPQLIALYL